MGCLYKVYNSIVLFASFLGLKLDRERGTRVSGFFAYDRTMRRVRELEDIDTKGTRAAYDTLTLHEVVTI